MSVYFSPFLVSAYTYLSYCTTRAKRNYLLADNLDQWDI